LSLQRGESAAKVSPGEPQAKRRAWLTWGRFVVVFFLVMWGLTVAAMAGDERSVGDTLIGPPIAAAFETLIVVALLQAGIWLFSRLRQ
jgi:hypothetical protein